MIHYHFSYENPLSHFLSIKFQINQLASESVKLYLPVWRPGRYEIQNFPKRIRGFKVSGQNATPLPFRKVSKDCWEIELLGSKSIEVSYEYYAGLMDAGNSWLDNEQLYINPVNCCLYESSRMNEPISISFDLPKSYEVASGLKPIDQQTVEAKNYYQLVDSPIFASPSLRTITYEIDNIEFFIHIQGELPKSDDEITKDFKSFSEKQMDVMSGFPCKHYHFLIQSLPYRHYHGVEHRNSTVICIGPSEELTERKLYKEFLGVSSHELFHIWNVIRLRPKEMTPYDFQAENYHQTGFVTEGVTTYYGDLFLARAGVFTKKEYLSELNKLLKRHFENEGRANYSVGESSYDLWLDGYEAGIPGRKVSIYNEGALAALILDLKIRLKHDSHKSLDDVIRLMWKRHGEQMTGYSFEDYQSAAENVYGESLKDYFEQIILGNIPFEKYLAPLFHEFGMAFNLKNAEKPEEMNFGFRFNDNKVVAIATGSPAYEKLSINDTILKVNGEKPKETFPSVDSIELEVLRMGKTRHLHLNRTGKSYFQIYQVDYLSELTEDQANRLKNWLEKSI